MAAPCHSFRARLFKPLLRRQGTHYFDTIVGLMYSLQACDIAIRADGPRSSLRQVARSVETSHSTIRCK